jgi:prolyl oligopeptidase
MNYPAAPRTDLVETLHGVRLPDPFRRLESAGDPDTAAWVAAENALTRAVLDTPERATLVARLRELHRVPRASVPAVRGNRIFFTENDGTRGQPVLCMLDAAGGAGSSFRGAGTADAAHRGARTVLVDPNLLDAGGTTAITAFEPDATGDRVIYGLSLHGSDAQELLIHDVAGHAALADRLRWVKFASLAWWGDGFFYTRYPEPGTVLPEHDQYFCQVRYHAVGDPQDADRLVYHRPDAPEIVFEVDVTADGRHLVITSHRGASDDAEVHVIDLAGASASAESQPAFAAAVAGPPAPRALVTGFSSGWHFIDGSAGRLYFRTDAGAPFGRVVRFDLAAPESGAAVVVAESGDTIVDAAVANGRLLVSSLRNASSRLTARSLEDGTELEVALPELGSIVGLGAGWNQLLAFATFTSFTSPATIMACDIERGRLEPIEPASLPFDPAGYITEQVWYRSKDGTPISMFLVSRRDSRSEDPASAAPTHDDPVAGAVLLSGYGGFNISVAPSFDPSDFLWLDRGGVMAVANLRGGGEYGDAWHRAGMRERKQNVFDDFIAAAEWLYATGRAAPGRIAIEGGSNGGLLVGACMVQRPDLFGAVVCRVPVADMLRYHLFTVGRFWIPEYGCADEIADFAYLIRYSPYHNVSNGAAYPPTLILTADTDDRVAPGMAKKFAARLQEAVGTHGGPILLRVETRAGHGAGKPIEKQVAEQSDIYSFLFHNLTRTSESEQTRR